MPAAGGPAEQVTRNGGNRPVVSADGHHVYYWRGNPRDVRVKSPGEQGVWRVTRDGGDETQVLHADVRPDHWAATPTGIYFLRQPGSSRGSTLEFFNFATRRVTQIGTFDLGSLIGGDFTVSPDERRTLYSQGRFESDLMLVENFR